jgi:hypothetical protein
MLPPRNVMQTRFSLLERSQAAVVGIALAVGLACSSMPRTQPETGFEMAVVVDSGPAALEIVMTRGAEVGQTLRLEEPERFVVARVWREQDPTTGYPVLGFELRADEKARFEDWTAARIDRTVALLVNRRVWSVATIQDRLPGVGLLTGGGPGFSEAEVEQILRDLDVPE